MKRSRSIFIPHLLLLCGLVTLYSCSKPDTPDSLPPVPVDTTVQVKNVKIDQSDFLLLPTRTMQLTATITPANASNKNVKWQSGDANLATVDEYGLVTALKEGSVTITATSNSNPQIKGVVKLIVLKSYQVIAVGESYLPGGGESAVYWENGQINRLNGKSAYGIIKSGDDLYISGTVRNKYNYEIPVFWKNAERTIVGDLDGDEQGFALGIAVKDNKVLLTQNEFSSNECPRYCSGRSKGSYFVSENGNFTEVLLYNDSSASRANAILVDGEDVLVAGTFAKDSWVNSAVFWRNDSSTIQELSPADGYYEALAIGRDGADIYYAGYGGCPYTNCNAKAYIWKNNNNTTISLTDGSFHATATCLAFSSGIIYAAGYERNALGHNVAKFWKIDGNKVSSYSLGDGQHGSMINAIQVVGKDIFLLGTVSVTLWDTSAKCWRAFEDGSNMLVADVSDYYVPFGYHGNGILVR